jgi:hypothetical protein
MQELQPTVNNLQGLEIGLARRTRLINSVLGCELLDLSFLPVSCCRLGPRLVFPG